MHIAVVSAAAAARIVDNDGEQQQKLTGYENQPHSQPYHHLRTRSREWSRAATINVNQILAETAASATVSFVFHFCAINNFV